MRVSCKLFSSGGTQDCSFHNSNSELCYLWMSVIPVKSSNNWTTTTTPDMVFNKIGIDYAVPVYIEQGSVCKPVILKTCIISVSN